MVRKKIHSHYLWAHIEAIFGVGPCGHVYVSHMLTYVIDKSGHGPVNRPAGPTRRVAVHRPTDLDPGRLGVEPAGPGRVAT